MKLISMTDFVLEQKELKIMRLAKLHRIENYANFLSQKTELWMFIPCDEDGNVLEEPKWENEETDYEIQILVQEYQQAKERCLFDGVEWNVAQFCDEPMIELNDKNGNYLVYDIEDKNFQDADELFFETIEDLVLYNIELTPTAQKQIGL